MRIIKINNPHRKKHFEFFKRMAQPHFNIGFNVEISTFYQIIKNQSISLNATIVYILSRTANEIEKFRYRVRDDHIIVHDVIHPSYSIPTKASEVFSFCTVEFDPDMDIFLKAARLREEELQKNPSFEDAPGRDDFLFLSAIPWIPFTSFRHAMHVPSQDSVPRIVWGKYFKEQDKLWMPISVQLHHAVADGKDLGAFYEKLQEYLNHFDELI
jgi:chloramphenicol O-acetyltransferase type A